MQITSGLEHFNLKLHKHTAVWTELSMYASNRCPLHYMRPADVLCSTRNTATRLLAVLWALLIMLNTQVAYGADWSDKWLAGKKPELIKVQIGSQTEVHAEKCVILCSSHFQNAQENSCMNLPYIIDGKRASKRVILRKMHALLFLLAHLSINTPRPCIPFPPPTPRSHRGDAVKHVCPLPWALTQDWRRCLLHPQPLRARSGDILV